MRYCFFIVSKYFLCLFFVFSACTKSFSEISICSNLQEGDSISVALYSYMEDRYATVNGASVTSSDVARGRVNISLPDSLLKNIGALSITIHCYSDSILAISSIRLKGFATFYPQDIMNLLWWQDGLMFEIDSKSNTIKSPINENIPGTFPIGISAFYKSSHLLGIQLFFRLSLIATLLIFTLVFTIQAPTHRLPLFTIALFLASIPLKTDYTNYTMGIMILTMFISFIYNKSRRFTWQPVFYVLCAMYLMNVIGLLYTNDFNHGIKRLDTCIVLILFPAVFSMFQFPKKNVLLLLRFFVWSTIAFCAFGLLSYATIVPEFTWNMVFRDSKLYAPLLMMWPAHPHPSFLSTILLMAVPVSLYLRFGDEKQITLIEMLFGVLLPVVFTILSGARVGLVIAPALLALGYLFYCRFKPVLKWGILVVGIVLSGIFLHNNVEHAGSVLLSDPIRTDLRKTAISAISEKPVFGWGTGAAMSLIKSEERAHSLGIETPYDFTSFHNHYLEDMVQFGIPGIILLLTLFGWILWIGLREKNFLLLSLLAIYSLFCWTESALFISKAVIPFTFWLCFFMTNRENINLSLTQCNKSISD